jgi:predicted phage-related endonuclease
MITDEIRQRRRNYLCASDWSQVVGVNPFGSAYDVWVSKVYDTTNDETASMRDGNDNEEYIVADICKHFGFDRSAVITDAEKLWHERGIYSCNLDGDNPGMEAKYTTESDDWGALGSEHIPDHFFLQVQFQMLVTGYEQIHVGVWICHYGIDKRFYVIKRNDELIGRIERAGAAWWNKYVVPAKEILAQGGSLDDFPKPSMDKPSLKTFKKIIRRPGKVAKLNGADFDIWQLADDQAKAAKKRANECKAKLLDQVGDAEAGELPDGSLWKKNGRNAWQLYEPERIEI